MLCCCCLFVSHTLLQHHVYTHGIYWSMNSMKLSNPRCHYMGLWHTFWIQCCVCAIFQQNGKVPGIKNVFLWIWTKLGHLTWLRFIAWRVSNQLSFALAEFWWNCLILTSYFLIKNMIYWTAKSHFTSPKTAAAQNILGMLCFWSTFSYLLRTKMQYKVSW